MGLVGQKVCGCWVTGPLQEWYLFRQLALPPCLGSDVKGIWWVPQIDCHCLQTPQWAEGLALSAHPHLHPSLVNSGCSSLSVLRGENANLTGRWYCGKGGWVFMSWFCHWLCKLECHFTCLTCVHLLGMSLTGMWGSLEGSGLKVLWEVKQYSNLGEPWGLKYTCWQILVFQDDSFLIFDLLFKCVTFVYRFTLFPWASVSTSVKWDGFISGLAKKRTKCCLSLASHG